MKLYGHASYDQEVDFMIDQRLHEIGVAVEGVKLIFSHRSSCKTPGVAGRIGLISLAMPLSASYTEPPRMS